MRSVLEATLPQYSVVFANNTSKIHRHAIEWCMTIPIQHHICYFRRFPASQFNDNLGGVDLKCTQWVQFRSTQPKLYFPKIMEFSHYNEYGVIPRINLLCVFCFLFFIFIFNALTM